MVIPAALQGYLAFFATFLAAFFAFLLAPFFAGFNAALVAFLTAFAFCFLTPAFLTALRANDLAVFFAFLFDTLLDIFSSIVY